MRTVKAMWMLDSAVTGSGSPESDAVTSPTRSHRVPVTSIIILMPRRLGVT